METQPAPGVWPENFLATAKQRAAFFVSPEHTHSKTGVIEPRQSEFHERFRGHPWVEKSIREGWGPELRGYLRNAVTGKILRGEPYANVEALMPSRGWIADASERAKRMMDAEIWQKSKAEEYGTFDQYLMKTRKQRAVEFAQ